MTEKDQDIQMVTAFIKETNSVIDEVRKLAMDESADPDRIESKMDELTQRVEQLRAYPADVWQEARNDIMGLSGNLDAMQKTLTKEYEKAKQGLTQLRNRARAEKSYAVHTTPDTTPDTTNEDGDNNV